MFRRLESSLPPDPHFEPDLEKLGYFLTEHDEIRSIQNPNERFKYNISKNDRVNEMQSQAMNTCIRRIIKDRLISPPLSMEVVRIPLGTTEKDPHVPILISPTLSTRKNIVLVIGESFQDLGIFAYRRTNEHINDGSGVDFVKAAHNSTWRIPGSAAETAPGVILTNPGQLNFHRRTSTPMTLVTWHAIPRKTAVSASLALSSKNVVPQNGTATEHLLYILNHILSDSKFVAKEAKLYIVGIANGGALLVKYLAAHWTPVWADRIAAIALMDPQHELENLPRSVNPGFKDFLSAKTRAYILSHEPKYTPLEGRDIYGCNCYSGGEPVYGELVLCECWEDVLGWFKHVAGWEGGYCELEFGGSKKPAAGLDNVVVTRAPGDQP